MAGVAQGTEEFLRGTDWGKELVASGNEATIKKIAQKVAFYTLVLKPGAGSDTPDVVKRMGEVSDLVKGADKSLKENNKAGAQAKLEQAETSPAKCGFTSQ